MKNHILLTILASAVLGCASSQTKNTSKSVASVPALESSAYMSVRTTPTPAPEKCPSSDKSWRKESVPALQSLANICSRLGKADRVNQMGQLLAQKEPNSPWGPFYMSVAAEQQKELPLALWMIELAIKKSPHTALLYYQKGRIHWALGEWSHAVEDYNLAIKENPRFVDPYLFLAQLNFRDQDFSKSAKYFSTVIEIEPANTTALVGLAETRILQGRAKDSVELYEQAVNLSPRNLQYRLKLAGLYENAQKDYGQALAAYKRIHSMMAESRAPDSETQGSIGEKIKHLESLVNSTQNEEKKITKSDVALPKKVKK